MSSIMKPLVIGLLAAVVGFVAAIGMLTAGVVWLAVSITSGDRLQPNEAWTAPKSATYGVWAQEVAGKTPPVSLMSSSEQIELNPTIVTSTITLGSTSYVLTGTFEAEQGVAYTVQGSSAGAMIRKHNGIWGVLGPILVMMFGSILFVGACIVGIVVAVSKIAKGKPAPAPALAPSAPQ